MEIVACDRGVKYVHNNYIYRFNKCVNRKTYYRCHNGACPSRVIVKGAEVSLQSPHNHLEEKLEIDRLFFRRELRQEARNRRVELRSRQIFDRVSERHPNVAVEIPYQEVRNLIYRNRAHGVPPIPHSLAEFSATLKSEQWADLNSVLTDPERRPFFRELIGGEDVGWTAAVYVSPRLASALVNTHRLHIDATFKTLPRELRAYQLLTIHAEHMNFMFPVVFALMSRKTQQAYHGVFSYIHTVIPGWAPRFVMTDFEPAMRNAAQVIWPTAHLLGCFFHYAQAVFRMHTQLLMRPLTDTNLEAGWALQMLMALALLPASRVATGLEVVKYYVRQHNLSGHFRMLIGYMKNYWMETIGPATFSVYHQVHRTNNAVEGFYSQLLKVMGTSPGVWNFHHHLRQMEMDQYMDLERLLNGFHNIRPRRRVQRGLRHRRPRVQARQDANIQDAERQLDLGRYSEADFLHRMAHCTKSLAGTLSGRNPRAAAAAEQRRPAVPLMPPLNPIPRAPVVLAPVATPAPIAVAGPTPGSVPGPAPVTLPGPTPVATLIMQQETSLPATPTPCPYRLYRAKPIVPVEGVFMGLREVKKQREELLLSLDLGEEPACEVLAEGEIVCTMCFSNAPTRVCTPCGHAIICRPCLPAFVKQKKYHCAIMGDGSIFETHIRLPITCPTCRCIAGQLILTYI